MSQTCFSVAAQDPDSWTEQQGLGSPYIDSSSRLQVTQGREPLPVTAGWAGLTRGHTGVYLAEITTLFHRQALIYP